MNSKSFSSQLKLNIQAGAPIIQIISHETLRIRAATFKVASELGTSVYIWDRTNGLREYKDSLLEALSNDYKQPHEILELINTNDDNEVSLEGSIFLIEDFHPNIQEHEHQQISRLRNFSTSVSTGIIKDCTIILSQPYPQLPPELEKEVQVMMMELPNTHDLEKLAQQAKQRFQLDDRDFTPTQQLLEAALGLSTSEAQLAFAKAACDRKRLTDAEIPLIVSQKEQVIRKSGHLEYFHPQATLNDIGGLDNLKSWLNRRKQSFSEDAKNYGLETPRGVLLLGLPGTGKSLAAKAVANAWQLPLLRLDMGKIYGGIVGQSEENMRQALQLAETLSPSILWVDEIEKGLSGMQSSGSTDGGTTARVLGSFLTWMQEKEKPVFVVATANNIAQLPPELLRKGRVDEIFFVDLPVETDRVEILNIHLKNRDRLDDFSHPEIQELAIISQGFTGAELEEAVKEAMFLSFDAGRALAFEHLKKAIQNTSPLSLTMHEIIDNTRKWANGRAVPASSERPEPLDDNKSSSQVRLKQEGENPFL